MANLKLASTKIPIELMERLNRFTELTGLTQSAAIRQAIEQFLDNTELTGLAGLTAIEGNLTPSQLVTTDNSVNSRLTVIEARLAALEIAIVTNSPNTTSKAPPIEPTSTPTSPIAVTKKAPAAPTPLPPIAGALTTGQLFKALKALGYSKTDKTLSRLINQARATQQLPSDLIALGVRADWETRANAKATNNRVRWLRFDG